MQTLTLFIYRGSQKTRDVAFFLFNICTLKRNYKASFKGVNQVVFLVSWFWDSLYVCIYLAMYLIIYLFFYLSLYLSIYLYIYLSILHFCLLWSPSNPSLENMREYKYVFIIPNTYLYIYVYNMYLRLHSTTQINTFYSEI